MSVKKPGSEAGIHGAVEQTTSSREAGVVDLPLCLKVLVGYGQAEGGGRSQTTRGLYYDNILPFSGFHAMPEEIGRASCRERVSSPV